MYIDLESDYVAKNKDKLNMVVTPQIVDNATCNRLNVLIYLMNSCCSHAG